MDIGIPPDADSTSPRPTPPGIGAAPARAWLRVCRWTARRREHQALAELNDRLLRDVGVIRDRDIGVGCAGTPHEYDKQIWPP